MDYWEQTKAILRPSLNEYYKFQYVDLQTPLRKNMLDLRSKESMRLLMKARRKIETVIGQLVDRYKSNNTSIV